MPESSPASESPGPGSMRRFARRWVRRLLALGLCGLLLIYFTPLIAIKLGVLKIVSAHINKEIDGTLSIGSASFGWLSSIELHDVEIKDADGRSVLKAPRVLVSKSIYSLARDPMELGTLAIERPQIEILCTARTSNLERVLERILHEPPRVLQRRRSVTVEISDAQVTLIDAESQNRWTLNPFAATTTVPASPDEPIRIQARAVSESGSMDTEVALGNGVELKLKTEKFPMAMSTLLVRRVDPGLHVSGLLTTDLSTVIVSTPTTTNIKATGLIAATGLEVRSPRLGSEPLTLAAFDLPCSIETKDGIVNVERADLKTDLGTASISGTFDPTESVEQWLNRSGIVASADLDLAKVAGQFPQLLHLRPGTAIHEGHVKFRLASKPGTNSTVWEGNVATSALRGTRDGKPLAWEQPLQAAFLGRLTPERLPVFERLAVQSEFATINGKGGVDDFTVNADVSLDRLAARLSEFVDLGGIKLSGTAKMNLANKGNGKGGSQVSGRVDLSQFTLADGKRNFSEPQLAIDFRAEGKLNPNGPLRIDSGTMTTSAATDSLEITLAEPIPDIRTLQAGRVITRLSGDLLRWRNRTRGILPIPPDYVIAGTGSLGGTMRFDAQKVTFDSVTGDLNNLRFYGLGLKVDEQIFKLYPTNVMVDRATGMIDIPQLSAACQSIGLAAEKIRILPRPNGDYDFVMSGRAKANLLRLQRVLQLQSDPALSDAISGIVSDGAFSVESAGPVYRFRTSFPVQDFVLGDPRNPTWMEPNLMVRAEGDYDSKSDQLIFTSSRIERPGSLEADVAGSIQHLTTTQDLDLSGKVRYDLAQLEPQLKRYLGPSFKASGMDTREFRVSGSWSPVNRAVAPRVDSVAGTGKPTGSPGYANLSGHATLAWKSLQAYGFDVGEAEMKAVLSKGVLRFDPLEASFGQTGKVRLHPTIRLDTPTYDMTLSPGKIVNQARLTPAACADALGYALPAIARSTATEGTVSFELEDNVIPLSNPEAGRMKGRLTLHQVQVGPGPLISEIAQLMGASQTRVQLANEQVVPIRMENGRVYHENLQLSTSNFSMTTTGSVGVDGSLQMIAELPIPESSLGPLLRNTPKLRDAVASKRIRLPIAGTINAPRLDRNAFQIAVRQYVEEVARDAARGKLEEIFDRNQGKLNQEIEKGRDRLRGEIEKGLGKFLPIPPPPPPQQSPPKKQ